MLESPLLSSAASCVALTLLVLFCCENHSCLGDVNSGCPSWGCLPWGSFSLSAGIPSLNSTVPWRVEIETVHSGDVVTGVPRGCVSDQQTVVCTTQSGYVSIDPTNGKKLWNYTTMSTPYLPIMDIYGDVIGMDNKALYYVGGDGKPKHPIKVGILKPMYSLMVANNSIMFLTASTNKTAQIVTYDTDGIVDGSIPLLGSINLVNGTFIPCSQPIIAGFRAYVMTYFFPDEMDSKEAQQVSGMLRLYAIDVLKQMAPRIVISWYFNFGRWKRQFITKKPSPSKPYHLWHLGQNSLDPIVTYFNGNIYVNVPGNLDDVRGKESNLRQPYPGSLWAIRDDGEGGSLLFRTSCLYGSMAVYDTFDKPLSKFERNQNKKNTEEENLLWIINRSPAMIQGYNASNGTVKDISGFDKIFQKLNGWITSSLSITRSKSSPNKDQLVFGTTDPTSGQASISVVEIADGQAKLVLSRVVNAVKTKDKTYTQAMVEGQIVNFAFYPSNARGVKGGALREKAVKDTWTLGLAAIVTESNATYTSRSVVGLF